MHQNAFAAGALPQTPWGADSAPHTPYLDLREPSTSRRDGGEGEGKRTEGMRKEERMERIKWGVSGLRRIEVREEWGGKEEKILPTFKKLPPRLCVYQIWRTMCFVAPFCPYARPAQQSNVYKR